MTTYIWRYLDLSKFVHLISTKTLHFSRIDQFTDKFEGSYPRKNLIDWQNKYPEVGDFKHWRKFACVSCWYKSEHESASMWELYTQNNQGLSIRSTTDRLKNSVKDTGVFIEKIKYIDFLRGKADILTPNQAFLYKRIEFKCEDEVRAVLFKLPPNAGFDNGFPIFGSVEKNDGFPENGIDIPVDCNNLIDKIVLSPYSKKWFKEVVKNLLMRFTFKSIEIIDSELSSDPIYPKQ